jgi:GntR family transcriptional regulator / MocR family aminotransferase
MHLIAWFPRLDRAGIDRLAAACRARDVGVYPIAAHAVRRLKRQGLILGYGLVDEQAIEEGVRVIAECRLRMVD